MKEILKNYCMFLLRIGFIKNSFAVILGLMFPFFGPKYFKLQNGLQFLFRKYHSRTDAFILYEVFCNNDYDKPFLEIRNGDTIIDIGGQMGSVSLYFAGKYPSSHIHTFEPIEDNYNAIVQNIAFNKKANIIANNLAIWSDNNGIKIYESMNNSGGHSIIDWNTSKQCQILPTINLDNYCESHKIDFIGFMKCDCEGSEYEIFKSLGREFFEQKVGKIAMEWHLVGEYDADTIVNILGNDFIISVVDNYLYALNKNFL